MTVCSPPSMKIARRSSRLEVPRSCTEVVFSRVLGAIFKGDLCTQ